MNTVCDSSLYGISLLLDPNLPLPSMATSPSSSVASQNQRLARSELQVQSRNFGDHCPQALAILFTRDYLLQEEARQQHTAKMEAATALVVGTSSALPP
jgi:hypothetical protein